METTLTIALFAIAWLANGALLTYGYIRGTGVMDRPGFLLDPTPTKVILSCLLIQFRYQLINFAMRKQKGLTPFIQTSIIFLIFWGATFWISRIAAKWIVGFF